MKLLSNILALSIGKEKEFSWKEKSVSSAIGKTRVKKVELTYNGFVGDGVANPTFHGGPDRAVCYYSYEHYTEWEKEFDVQFNPPVFGENICGTGYVEKETYIGDIFSLGTSIVQVSQGRIPCATISKYNHIETFLPRIVETCYTGYFLKVLEEGVIKEDSSFTLIDRTQEVVTVWDATRVMLLDRKNIAAMEHILQIESLAEDWKGRFKKAIDKLNQK